MEVRYPPLSKRLKMDADLVAEGAVLADVGCDHAYCSIYLAAAKRIRSAIAMDVREGPLERARANIRRYGVEDMVAARLSDGLKGLRPGEADCILIGGMGGLLMQEILEQGLECVYACHSLVLQPQSELAGVRRYLHSHGLWITKEDMCQEDGKYYTVMRAEKAPEGVLPSAGVPEYQPGELEQIRAEQAERYGPCLIRQKHPVLREYLERESQKMEVLIRQLSCQGTERAKERLRDVCREKEMLDGVLEGMEERGFAGKTLA